MRDIIFIAIFLSSSYSFAQLFGLETFSKDFNKTQKIEVGNMPPVRSQDTLGICYGCAPSAIIEQAMCSDQKSDCKSLSNDKRPSLIDLTRYATNSIKDRSDPDSYPLSLRAENAKGFSVDVLQSVFSTGTIIKESCAPFDQLVSKVSSAKGQRNAEAAMWKQFEDAHNLFQKKFKDCKQCALDEFTTTAKELREKYNLKTSNEEVLKALSATSLREFQYQMLVPKNCDSPSNRLKFLTFNKKLTLWPGKDELANANYSAAIERIKTALKNNKPVLINSFCMLQHPTIECAESTPDGQDSGTHSVVITGYSKMCNAKGDCYDSIKVHNCWGQSWQDQNDDGWVNAKNLVDRTMYLQNSLSWIDNK